MSRGYSATTVVCLCALTFVVGCLVQQLPGLPDVSTGFQRTSKKNGLRRQAIEVQSQQEVTSDSGSRVPFAREAAPQEVLSADQPVVASKLPATFDEATEPLLLPSIEPGDSGNDFHTTQPYQLISWYPRMYLFPKFMDDERCDHVVKIASARLGPSALAFRPGDNPDNTRDVRTSQGTFMARRDDPDGVLAWVEEKIAAMLHLPVKHGEPFNILRYQVGQHYDSHYDVFEPESYGPQNSQRMATVLFYLTDVEEGGETVFPLEGKHGMDRLPHIDYRSCKDGYKYKPRKGDALAFFSMHPNGTFDKHALHGGCPVVKGEKMVMTKWIRDHCFGFC